jgi:RHH-type transcriptional regulator, proline utilization regulon repressor / proline dehydrogenase / delta 1-pyrroline-5-carboxylate dehydrogenase
MTMTDLTWKAIFEYYRVDETQRVQSLLEKKPYTQAGLTRIQALAKEWVLGVRRVRLKEGGLDAFMFQYDLSTQEGIALMCLAESLLRIPDKQTVDQLIKEKLSKGDWSSHMGKSHSSFVNAATWALMLTGKVIADPLVDTSKHDFNLTQSLKRLASKGGEPIVRQAISSAMRILSKQFVMGRTIDEGLKRANEDEKKGYRYSYDMLGEAAYTKADAARYYQSYEKAIQAIGAYNQKGPIEGPGISVKLSALHPRFEYQKHEVLQNELIPKVKELAYQAKAANIGFCLDAEEASTLILLLDVMHALISDPKLKGWDGLGLAVQAYQKRAPFVLDWLKAVCEKHERRILVRLVKGAYWDTEIKIAQVEGHSDYPVFTRKISTDVNYLFCANKMLDAGHVFYPQFATHNAFTVAAVVEMAEQKSVHDYEFQCLHGMGRALYDQVLANKKLAKPCRIYAPVGTHEDLLAYLVRRLLENGANTSFVNRIADEQLPIEEIVADPFIALSQVDSKPHPQIPRPKCIFGKKRLNSSGIDWTDPFTFDPILAAIEAAANILYQAEPTTLVSPVASRQVLSCYSPNNLQHEIGRVTLATADDISASVARAQSAFPAWSQTPVKERTKLLRQLARLLHQNRATLLALLVQEGGKTLDDAAAELREAIDYCRYYAAEADEKFAMPQDLVGPTGELNCLKYTGRGVMVCISPWNFPLAIFLGQITAALAAGNCVISKPAQQTPLVAAFAIKLCHEAGFSPSVVQLLPGEGKLIGSVLINDTRVQGVMFTGSTATARTINQTLANRIGPIVPFIAETGGQNAMVVDSTALPEQVVADVVTSAFKSAGQRCSSLRVLYLQEEIADKVLTMLIGAMAELSIDNPIKLSTDIGPIIDKKSRETLLNHAMRMQDEAKLLYQVTVPTTLNKGVFLGPMLFEIQNISQLPEEVFGPILHVIRFKRKTLDQIIDDINGTGYGLTLGIHTRIEETAFRIHRLAHVGNTYVNRNMTGAVVGVQPFGGECLSGTGPKAGGPNYLMRLVTERTLTVNTTATGGNAQLMSLSEF